MMRFPEIPTHLIFSQTEAPAEGAEAKPAEAKPAEGQAAETAPAEAPPAPAPTTTSSQVPVAPQQNAVLDPISGGQVFMLTMFGVVAFIVLVAMTRYGKSNNYGD